MLREFSFEVDEENSQWNTVFQFSAGIETDGTALDLVNKIIQGDVKCESGRILNPKKVLLDSLEFLCGKRYLIPNGLQAKDEIRYLIGLKKEFRVEIDLNKTGLDLELLKSLSDIKILEPLVLRIEDWINEDYDGRRVEIFTDVSWNRFKEI